MERLLQRKELRLAAMQEKMEAQANRLEELEARQRQVEQLPGWRIFKKVARGWRLLANTRGCLHGLYRVLASLPGRLAMLLLPAAFMKGKKGPVRKSVRESVSEECSDVFSLKSEVKQVNIRRKMKRCISENLQ